ncbi:MAG: hypothetical protein JW807_12915 [Spirochaetes bacterium]|nr:hypothetical protein [Spirochaetota bacterium]
MNITNVSRWLTIIAVVSLVCAPGYGAEHEKKEVVQLVDETEAKLSTIKSSGNADLVRNEISSIERHIAEARKLLSGRDVDLAFNEISLGMLYFAMIDARIELKKATNELNETKDKYSE